MAIHSAHAAALLVLDERVGRHRDDGHRTRVVAVERANDAGRLVAVHLGHLDVHEDQVDGARVRALERAHGLGAVDAARTSAPAIGQHLGRLSRG